MLHSCYCVLGAWRPFLSCATHTMYRWSLWPKSLSWTHLTNGCYSRILRLCPNAHSLHYSVCKLLDHWFYITYYDLKFLTHDIISEGFSLNSTLLIWRRDVICPTLSKQGWQDYRKGQFFENFFYFFLSGVHVCKLLAPTVYEGCIEYLELR